MGVRIVLWMAMLLTSCALAVEPRDADKDGLDDAREQELLERFLPTFQVSRSECDGAPAEFAAGEAHPRVVARNGTIYGQAFPRKGGVEIHYYHLWGRDCGAAGHALDAEHVSVLVGEDGKALYWYAAAHEDTVCDVGGAAKAAELGAEDGGATIWVSHGKHASFLSQARCNGGCGGDACAVPVKLAAARVINLGEPDYPMAGARWIRSNRWPLLAKMSTDFDEALLARLAAPGPLGIVSQTAYLKTPQAVFLSSTVTAGALSTAGSKTDGALGRSAEATDTAVRSSAGATGRALKKSFEKTGRFLRLGRR